MPEKKIQEQLDAQIKAKRVAQVVEVSEAPTLTSEIFERDARETAIVVVNFRDESARLVETSDAPKVTREVLETLGKPVKTVEFFYENSFWQVAVRDGIPLELEIKQLKIMMEYADREGNRAEMEERDLEISRMLLSGMMVDPSFSYLGVGEGIPIETRSPVMIASLAAAFSAVNSPEEDAIFQVTVRRGVPADAFAITGETFEFYPVGGKQKKYTEMSDDELAADMARNTARRQVLVPAMIVDPKLSYTPVADDTEISDDEVAEAVEVPDDENAPYPVELLSERFLRTFNEAHRVTNIPEAGLKALQRFLRSSADTAGTDTGGELVGEQQGDGNKAGG